MCLSGISPGPSAEWHSHGTTGEAATPMCTQPSLAGSAVCIAHAASRATLWHSFLLPGGLYVAPPAAASASQHPVPDGYHPRLHRAARCCGACCRQRPASSPPAPLPVCGAGMCCAAAAGVHTATASDASGRLGHCFHRIMWLGGGVAGARARVKAADSAGRDARDAKGKWGSAIAITTPHSPCASQTI